MASMTRDYAIVEFPDWVTAEWAARDQNGEWWAFELEPSLVAEFGIWWADCEAFCLNEKLTTFVPPVGVDCAYWTQTKCRNARAVQHG